jgi:hypothetical protein
VGGQETVLRVREVCHGMQEGDPSSRSTGAVGAGEMEVTVNELHPQTVTLTARHRTGQPA